MKTRVLLLVTTLITITFTGGVLWHQHSAAASEPATKDLPAGYLRASDGYITEFQAVKKSYTHLTDRTPQGYIFLEALGAFCPAAPQAFPGAPLVCKQPETSPTGTGASPAPPQPAAAVPAAAPTSKSTPPKH